MVDKGAKLVADSTYCSSEHGRRRLGTRYSIQVGKLSKFSAPLLAALFIFLSHASSVVKLALNRVHPVHNVMNREQNVNTNQLCKLIVLFLSATFNFH